MEDDDEVVEIEYPISGPMVEELVKLHSELLEGVPGESLELVRGKVAEAIQSTCFVFEDNWDWAKNSGQMCMGADATEETAEDTWRTIGDRFFEKVNN